MSKFAVVIHEEPAGGSGEVPALPGCYSQGETNRGAAHELAQGNRRRVLEVMSQAGRAPDDTVQIVELAV